MAVINWDIDTDSEGGYDYSSLNAWEAAEETNLVSDGNIANPITRASSGSADTPQCQIFGWTTGPTNYILIEAADGDQALKTGWDTSRYRLSVANNDVLNIYEQYVRVKGLQIEKSSSTADFQHSVNVGFLDSTSDIIISDCYIRGAGNNSYTDGGIFISDSDATVTIYNCIIISESTSAHSYNTNIRIDQGTETNIYNCILYGGQFGTWTAAGTFVITNCAVFFHSDDFAGSSGITFCASDDGTGTNPVAASGGDFDNEYISPATGDFTLLNSGNCFEGGADNPSSGLYTTDMEGDAYNVGGYSIGVDEFVSVVTDVFFEMLSQIEQGIKPLTAAGLGGVLQE